VTLPDGSTVPMWGLHLRHRDWWRLLPRVEPGGDRLVPVVITVTTGSDLQINLTNNLTFGGNSVPTSLTIVGQLGGGLGTTATNVASPDSRPAGGHVVHLCSRRAGATRRLRPPAQGATGAVVLHASGGGVDSAIGLDSPPAGHVPA